MLNAALFCSMSATFGSVAAAELPRAGMLGVQLAPVTPEAAQAAGLDAAQGIQINGTFPGTPAEKAGIRQGDIFQKMNGEDIADIPQFVRMMEKYHANDKLHFLVRRDGKSEEISFILSERPRESADDLNVLYDAVEVNGHLLRTIVTQPRKSGTSPAILFIPDLSPQSVDFWSANVNPPQKSLLYGLTRAGFVTMRVEPSGVGDSQGPPARDAALETYADWYAAGVSRLREYDFVDPQQVYLFSERMGSVVAPMVCKQAPVAGIVSFAGMGRNYIESRLSDTRRHNVMRQVDPSENNEVVRSMARFLAELCLNQKSPAEIVKEHPDMADFAAMLVQNEEYILGHHYRFMQSLGSLDPIAAWKGLNVNVLVLFGEADWVSGREDAEALANAINWERRRAKFVELPKTDGLYQKANDVEDSFLAGGAASEFNPEIIKVITQFVESTAKRAS
ncbi:MAG: PDZ domain-containing protein [Phycisphaerae bacterium]